MSKRFGLKDKYALVTGASMGIGDAIALDLASQEGDYAQKKARLDGILFKVLP